MRPAQVLSGLPRRRAQQSRHVHMSQSYMIVSGIRSTVFGDLGVGLLDLGVGRRRSRGRLVVTLPNPKPKTKSPSPRWILPVKSQLNKYPNHEYQELRMMLGSSKNPTFQLVIPSSKSQVVK